MPFLIYDTDIFTAYPDIKIVIFAIHNVKTLVHSVQEHMYLDSN